MSEFPPASVVGSEDSGTVPGTVEVRVAVAAEDVIDEEKRILEDAVEEELVSEDVEELEDVWVVELRVLVDKVLLWWERSMEKIAGMEVAEIAISDGTSDCAAAEVEEGRSERSTVEVIARPGADVLDISVGEVLENPEIDPKIELLDTSSPEVLDNVGTEMLDEDMSEVLGGRETEVLGESRSKALDESEIKRFDASETERLDESRDGLLDGVGTEVMTVSGTMRLGGSGPWKLDGLGNNLLHGFGDRVIDGSEENVMDESGSNVVNLSEIKVLARSGIDGTARLPIDAVGGFSMGGYNKLGIGVEAGLWGVAAGAGEDGKASRLEKKEGSDGGGEAGGVEIGTCEDGTSNR
jgi:hypothetical protein